MQSMLPQWMKMSKDPESVGAQFLNTFGLEFEEVESYLQSTMENMFISTADVSQIDITYKVPLVINGDNAANIVDSVLVMRNEENEYACELVDGLRDFYTAGADKNVAILDKVNNIVYVRLKEEWMNEDILRPVNYISVNRLPHEEYEIHHVWNPFDEFGLLLGVNRLHGERNAQFKERILDVFRKPANSTKQGIINGLSKDLNISGDRITLNELSDHAFRKSLLNEDGSPSSRLVNIAKKTNEILGSTWGNMSWDEAYWHSVEEDSIGLEYLPHVWDASMEAWKDDEFQSGIGDGNDLKVRAPEKMDNEQTFKYYVGLRGRKKSTELVNPEISFKYKLMSQGQSKNTSHKPENYRYTIVASEILNLYYIVRAHKYYYMNTAIDFDATTMNYRYDNSTAPGVEIVTGQTVMSPAADQYLKVKAYLNTNNKRYTPVLNSFTVNWEDSVGVIQSYTFTDQLDFDRNDASIVTNKMDIITTTTGEVALGYGDFYYSLDTREDFSKGVRKENIDINTDGTIQLTPFEQ